MTKKCNQVATLVGERWENSFEKSRRVYGDGLCPTIDTCGGGATRGKGDDDR